MWSADVAALSVDGWQPNEDAETHRRCTEIRRTATWQM